MKGYKAMLRDKLLPTWDLALQWCRCKGLWIDTVYAEHIATIGVNLRSENVKMIAGRKNKSGIYMSFFSTVNQGGFLQSNDPKMYEFWKNVDKWVSWFSTNSMFFYDALEGGTTKETLAYMYNDPKLVNFMIKHKHIYYGHK